ncbi:hypothetical protein DEEACLCL_00128 [Salmonella phage CRW-SP2]|nr:hypothetical protein DEEACLCL_00128 [Salmonella phage CRW-SP2]
MYTVSVSLCIAIQDNNVSKAIVDFSKYFANLGHNTINVARAPYNDETEQVTFRIVSKEPHVMFKQLETWANEGEDIPAELQDFYFDEAVYCIIAVPKEVTVVELVEIINFVMNAACLNRMQTSRLRNMYLADREGEVLINNAEIRHFNEQSAMRQAINILSQKLMGTDILKIINQKEEVSWPVH